MSQHDTLTPEQLDQHLDALLKAAGSALRHYTMQKSRAALRAALSATQPAQAAQPVQGVPDVATWLWLRFADYCRKQGMNPHHQNDLFAIVHDLRAMLASPTPPRADQKGQ